MSAGRYGIYKLNQPLKLTPDTHLFGGKQFMLYHPGALTARDDAAGAEVEWDVYVSLKFTGPDFEPDSKQTGNRVLSDRVFMVRKTSEKTAGEK
jgi:hypothetical protein